MLPPLQTIPCQIPARSPLYNLEPAGAKTPYVESSTGYVARLAEEHSTTLYYLFSEEVATHIKKPGTIGRRVSFQSFAKAADGLGVIAADLIEVFERLTLRQDLSFTTMLPWDGILSAKSLTREWRAWCPACYGEQDDSANKVYDQLLWRLQSVAVCVKHNRRLEHECPSCANRQLPLSHRLRPGFCGKCQAWLGHHVDGKSRLNSDGASGVTEAELRVAVGVGKLLEAAPDMSPSVIANDFVANLQKYFGHVLIGRGTPSRAGFPVDKQTIRCWLKGTQKPSLPLLLKASAAAGISLVDLFQTGGIEESEPAGEVSKRQKSVVLVLTVENRSARSQVNWQDPGSVARVEKRLRASLEANPPLSLTKLATEFNCTRGTLRKKFPELSAQVAAKASAYYRPSVSNERMAREIRAALKEIPPPPLVAVSRRIGPGASTTILHKKFPKESRQIVERYCSHAKRQLDNEAIEKKLRSALRRNPPPSMPQISRETGVARATLHRKFPDLCKMISSRFATHQRKTHEHNRERAKSEIRTICERAIREGVYPSIALIRSQLTAPCQSQVITDTRREVIAATAPQGSEEVAEMPTTRLASRPTRPAGWKGDTLVTISRQAAPELEPNSSRSF